MVDASHYYCMAHRDQEQAYLDNRKRWARGHETSYQRKYNKVTRNRNDSKSNQYAFYRSKLWSSLRQAVLVRDRHLCQYCLVRGIYMQGNTVDHIVPIEVDSSKKGTTNNLATCCPSCHKLKTAWEQRYYGTGIDNKIIKNSKIIVNIKEISEKIRA